MTSEVQWQNYLNDATDAIHNGQSLESIRSRYGIQYRDDNDLINLIERLNTELVTVEPSQQFANRLRNELMPVEQNGVIARVRGLPARVHWAAIVTAIVGGALIVVQQLFSGKDSLLEERTTIPEES